MQMKNYFKREKGSMAIYTIATILSFIIILTGIFFTASSVRKNQLRTLIKIEEVYRKNVNNKREVYDDLTAERMLSSDGTFSKLKGINTPNLGSGMTAIKWDETANNGAGDWVETTGDDKDWYDYSNKKWANAITEDGSMWVWIPRFAYQIESGYNKSGADINPDDATTGAGTINIKFMKGTTNEAADGTKTWDNVSGEGKWNIHPAFNYGKTVSGIWVAKFEASQSDAGANAADYQNSTGGTSGVIKIQPGVNSWRNITINDIYSKCLSYNTALNSHMMKNSEWGAVAYLAQSTYGKNSEVWINPNSNYITGQAGESVSASSTTTTYAYTDTTYGVNASTTGNVTGIYDMSGGSWEYVAAYVNNSYVVSGQEPYTYGSNVINGEAKTKNIYNMGTTDTVADNYAAAAGVYGDAVYETFSSGIGTNSWYRDYSYFPYLKTPFFRRGGCCSDGSSAGGFCFGYDNGYDYGHVGFRPVLVAL